jgi:dTDP-4-dehydrorhamnose reductase
MTAALKKVLVTGYSGLVGTHLVPRLDRRYRVTALSRNPSKLGNLETTETHALNLEDLENLRAFLYSSDFDIIVNCAAMSDVDRCETEHDKAWSVNTEAVSVMANYCLTKRILLIHISTDYVFYGHAGPYNEEAAPDPVNYYGVTKLFAEQAVILSRCPHIVVRTAGVYGNGLHEPSKLVRWVIDAPREGRDVLAATDLYSNPTWAGALADAIVKLLESDFRGIIHIAGADYINRHEFASIAADIFGVDKTIIKAAKQSDLNMAARRPLLAGLRVDKMRNVLGIEPVGIRDGLSRVYAKEK